MLETILNGDVVTQVLVGLGALVTLLAGLKGLIRSLEPIAKMTKTEKDNVFLEKAIKGIEALSSPINKVLDFLTDAKRG